MSRDTITLNFRCAFGLGYSEYVEAGWDSVIPVGANNTAPPSYTGANRAKPTEETYEEWRNSRSDSHLALVLPAGVVALDVDTKGSKNGLEDLAALEEALGELPATWRNSSRADASGHLYFRIPEHISFKSTQPERNLREYYSGAQSIEVLHSGYRYAYAWPTAHRETGELYNWYAPGEDTPFGAVPSPDDFPELPATWLSVLLEQPQGTKLPTNPDGSYSVSKRYCERQFQDAKNDVAKEISGHNEQRIRMWSVAVANNIDTLFGGDVDAAEEAYWAIDWFGDYHDEAMITNLWNSALTLPRNRLEGTEISAVELAETVDDWLNIVDWDELFEEDHKPDFLVGGLLERGEQMSLYGAGASGKSTFMRAWAVAMANGLPFLGTPAQEPVKVLYLDHENGRKVFARAFAALGVRPSKNLTYSSFPNMATLDSVQGSEQFKIALDHIAPDVVVFDSASRMIAGKEDASETWTQWHNLVLSELKKRNIASVRLDHPGKDESRGQRGSSAKTQDVDVIFKYCVNGQFRKLICERSRAGHFELEQEFTLEMCKENGVTSYRAVGDSPEVPAEDILRAAGATEGMSQNALEKLNRQYACGLTREQVREVWSQWKAGD